VARGYRELLAELQDAQKRLKQTPVRQLPLHAARHTFVSQAFARSMDPGWVSRQFGHHSVAFTLDTYVHLLPGRRDFAAVEFGDTSRRVGASGHNSGTRTQNTCKARHRTLH
jgi:integrase